jgi:hypothetical protein
VPHSFLETGNGLSKGPWLQVQRPYRLAEDHWEHLFDVPVAFSPPRGQGRAWERLIGKGRAPRHGLVTIGTVPRKAECLPFPVLHHCPREHEAAHEWPMAIEGTLSRPGALKAFPRLKLPSGSAGEHD